MLELGPLLGSGSFGKAYRAMSKDKAELRSWPFHLALLAERRSCHLPMFLGSCFLRFQIFSWFSGGFHLQEATQTKSLEKVGHRTRNVEATPGLQGTFRLKRVLFHEMRNSSKSKRSRGCFQGKHMRSQPFAQLAHRVCARMRSRACGASEPHSKPGQMKVSKGQSQP